MGPNYKEEFALLKVCNIERKTASLKIPSFRGDVFHLFIYYSELFVVAAVIVVCFCVWGVFCLSLFFFLFNQESI